jgi:hypothetical protein
MSTFRAMNFWAAILMSGVATIWVAMLSGVAYAVRFAPTLRASAGERTRTSKGARPNGT